ncbi:RecT family recombinase [Paenibacillus filicis]|uniref:RecT family recombinase n=1 Tax=Paenibacillus filicis TaxID=669464 RepID=A0ABU9DW61_9BACL
MTTQHIEICSALDALLEAKHDALGQGFNKVRFIENCKSYLPEVKNIERHSSDLIAATLFKGAVLGLDFLGRECHVIADGKGVQFQTDYKGEKKLAKKYSVRPVLDIYAKNVREGDDFREEIMEGKPSVYFQPLAFNNSPIKGTFAVALFSDGGMVYEALTAEEIELIRKNYGKNIDTWEKSQGEMYKRTALRRLCKSIELDFDTDQSLAFEAGSAVDFSQSPRPVQHSPLNPPESKEEQHEAE